MWSKDTSQKRQEVTIHRNLTLKFRFFIGRTELIAVGRGISTLARLRKRYGSGRWRKLKGEARIRLANGHIRRAETHWYEAHGVGRRGLKIKRFLD